MDERVTDKKVEFVLTNGHGFVAFEEPSIESVGEVLNGMLRQGLKVQTLLCNTNNNKFWCVAEVWK